MAAYPRPVVLGQCMNQFTPIATHPSAHNPPYWEGQESYRPLSNNAKGMYGGRSPHDYVAERLRDNPDGPPGVDLTEAKQLYLQAYQSLGGVNGLSSLELGHAAAYRAYCTLSKDPPLRNGTEYERETLIGLSVAEASRLMQQYGRDSSIYDCTAASEAAARTASRIFAQTRRVYDNEFSSRAPLRTNGYADPYEYEDDDSEYIDRPRRRGRSLSRTRHPAFADTAAVAPDMDLGYSTNRLIPGTSYSDVPATGPRYPPTPYPASDSGLRYPSTPYSVNNSGPGFPPTPYPATSNALVPQVYQVPRGGTSYYGHGTTISNPSFSRSRSASFSYPQQSYMTQMAPTSYSNMPSTYPAEQTIVIHQQKKHRHRHRHRHRSRSR